MRLKRGTTVSMVKCSPNFEYEKVGDAKKICEYINNINPGKCIFSAKLARVCCLSPQIAKNILQILSVHGLVDSFFYTRQKSYYKKMNIISISDVEEAQIYRPFKN